MRRACALLCRNVIDSRRRERLITIRRTLSKRIAILGSTGSIGCNALDVIANLGEPYRAVALCANAQIDKLVEQTKRFCPAAVGVSDERNAAKAQPTLEGLGAAVYCGAESLERIVERDDVDMVLAATVGVAGVRAVIKAVQLGKPVALANKEALVVAGALVMPEARKRNVPVLPVDSEHSAIFQAMLAGRRNEIKKVILTASGGPFRTTPIEQMKKATLDDALAHPTWRMGNKVTIDSATMFNKGLELLEACWLFDLQPNQIEIVIHPESIVHSMVEFVDGSVLAQLSPPDMRTPIQYALTYPERRLGIGRCMDWRQACSLNFHPPDVERFPAVRLAYRAAQAGGTAGAIFNAANESAVAAFVDGRITFGEIPSIVERTMDAVEVQPVSTLDDLLKADRTGRTVADKLILAK
jgi:1-deoxy-D-xylulose-5-phosphate reductoisomerase